MGRAAAAGAAGAADGAEGACATAKFVKQRHVMAKAVATTAKLCLMMASFSPWAIWGGVNRSHIANIDVSISGAKG